jgi:hypothetical protein
MRHHQLTRKFAIFKIHILKFVMRLSVLFTALIYSCTHAAGIMSDDTLARKSSNSGNSVYKDVFCDQLCKDVIGIINPRTNYNENYIFDRSLYSYKVDTLPQVRFWRNIMNLHEDTAIVSVAGSRVFIQKMSMRTWNCWSDFQKKSYLDSVRCARNIDTANKILVTSGKKFFYDFDRTSQNFQKGINCFIQNGVDPWFAQAILLIESPNKLQKSNVGAFGPFQLMKDVARMYGLKVNRHIDERADFERSAYAASSLLKKICIPRAQMILDSLKITGYSTEELWFKLLVMHVYHAGAYNVQKAVFAINPSRGDMDLIYNLWRTQTAKFKSASQNYSQLVLAAMLEMNERNRITVTDGLEVASQ